MLYHLAVLLMTLSDLCGVSVIATAVPQKLWCNLARMHPPVNK